jgi:hypothetical protein
VLTMPDLIFRRLAHLSSVWLISLPYVEKRITAGAPVVP